jgi:rod shape determining protein RodA
MSLIHNEMHTPILISYGRSSLVLSVLSLGLMQSIAARSRAEVSKHPKV